MAVRNDDALPSHPGNPYSYVESRIAERLLTEEGILQHVGPRWKLSVAETLTTGTLTLIISDPASVVNTSTRVEFEVDGTPLAPTTAPGTGLVNGTYTFTFTKDPKHNTIVSPIIHLKDGRDIRAGSETFDINLEANVVTITITTDSGSANFTVQFDTDTGVGAGKGQYSLNNGASYTSFATTSALVGSFSIAQTGSEQPILIRGKDAAGNAGPAVASVVPIVGTSGPGGGEFSALTNVLYDATTNQVQFGWAWSGDTASFNVYVRDGSGAYLSVATTAAGATSYLFTSALDLTTNHADPTADIGFYVEAVIGSTVGVRSTNKLTTYNHL